MTPDLQQRMTIWREKARNGTITMEEMKEAITALREGRKVAAVVSEASRRSKAKAEIKSADAMLDELGNI